MGQFNVNKKRPRKKKIDNKTDNKVDKKVHLEWLGLKQKIIDSNAQADKVLNIVADKTRKLDMGRINS